MISKSISFFVALIFDNSHCFHRRWTIKLLNIVGFSDSHIWFVLNKAFNWNRMVVNSIEILQWIDIIISRHFLNKLIIFNIILWFAVVFIAVRTLKWFINFVDVLKVV